jgi:hypothetical protein
MSHILHEDLSAGFCGQVYKIAVKVLSASKITYVCQECRGGKNIKRMRNFTVHTLPILLCSRIGECAYARIVLLIHQLLER